MKQGVIRGPYSTEERERKAIHSARCPDFHALLPLRNLIQFPSTASEWERANKCGRGIALRISVNVRIAKFPRVKQNDVRVIGNCAGRGLEQLWKSSRGILQLKVDRKAVNVKCSLRWPSTAALNPYSIIPQAGVSFPPIISPANGNWGKIHYPPAESSLHANRFWFLEDWIA